MFKFFHKAIISLFFFKILALNCLATEILENVFFENKKGNQYSQPKQNKDINVTVIVDVFRAFTTACYVLEDNPENYIITTKSAVISRLTSNFLNILLIGKPEIGCTLLYDIPNSPTRVKELEINNKNIFHRTAAGAKGILLASPTDIILAAGFVNAEATVNYIKTFFNPHVKIIPMGHEAATPSLEDNICAEYIQSLLQDQKMDLIPFGNALREGPGRYFFSDDQWQYPSEDFGCCLEVGRFNFAIQAEVLSDYAILRRCQ